MLRLCICPKCGRRHIPRTRSCPCGYIFSDNDPVYIFDDDAFEDRSPELSQPSSQTLPPKPQSPVSRTPKTGTSQKKTLHMRLFVFSAILILIFLIPFLSDRAYESGERDGITSGFSNGYISGYYDGRSEDRSRLAFPSDCLDDTVYITETGSKYHQDGCQYLHSSQIPTTRLDAIADGYFRCSRCDP